MSGHRAYLLALTVAVLFLAGLVVAQDATVQSAEVTTEVPSVESTTIGEFYPLSWVKVNYKPIVDNERLFRKYKQCLLAEKSVGCPSNVIQLKNLLPEVFETLCAKCLPAHIERVKEAVEYICKTRRDDYDEVRKAKDPDGSLQKKFEDKFGAVNC